MLVYIIYIYIYNVGSVAAGYIHYIHNVRSKTPGVWTLGVYIIYT